MALEIVRVSFRAVNFGVDDGVIRSVRLELAARDVPHNIRVLMLRAVVSAFPRDCRDVDLGGAEPEAVGQVVLRAVRGSCVPLWCRVIISGAGREVATHVKV